MARSTSTEPAANSWRLWPVLSIRQPWTELILSGKKDIEIRNWTHPYRGRIWLHAGTKIDSEAARQLGVAGPFAQGIVGSARLHGVLPFHRSSFRALQSRHRNLGDFDEGLCKYGWILKDVHRLAEPFQMSGQPRLFSLPEFAAYPIALAQHARQCVQY